MTTEVKKEERSAAPVNRLAEDLNESLVCPITSQIFFDPVTVSCGDTFERIALEKWLESNATCPCCKRDISAGAKSTSTSTVIKRLINDLFKSSSQKIKDQYFAKDLIDRAFGDFPYSETYQRLLVERLIKQPELLNSICDPEINQTVAYRLVSIPTARVLFFQNQQLQNLLTTQGFEAKITGVGPIQGVSLLYYFTALPEGVALLDKNEHLRGLITTQGFEAKLTGVGPHQGKSPLYCLTTTTETTEGLALLAKDERLRGLITTQGLESKVTGVGPDQGMSPLFWLTGTPEGRALLAKDERLRSLITTQGLESKVTGVGPDQGKSPLFLLINNPVGRALLRKDKRLFALISREGILAVYQKVSPEYQARLCNWLQGFENGEGKRLLDFLPSDAPIKKVSVADGTKAEMKSPGSDSQELAEKDASAVGFFNRKRGRDDEAEREVAHPDGHSQKAKVQSQSQLG